MRGVQLFDLPSLAAKNSLIAVTRWGLGPPGGVSEQTAACGQEFALA